MHSSCVEVEQQPEGGDVLVAIAALVTEGRTPTHQLGAKARGFSQGPHCSAVHTRQSTTATAPHNSSQPRHLCNYENTLCLRYSRMRSYVVSLWRKSLPLCIDVLLVPRCCNKQDLICHPSDPITNAYLLEQWHVNVVHRTHDFSSNFNMNQLINAIRSQLYFSQLSAWLDSPDEQVRRAFFDKSIVYSLTVPGETYGCARFASSAQQHHFPSTDLGHGVVVNVSLSNLPRAHHIPPLTCSNCEGATVAPTRCCGATPLDDRMQTSCTLNGKHRCEDYDEVEPSSEPSSSSAAPSASVSPRCSCIDDPPKLLNFSAKHCKLDSDPTASNQPDMNLVFTGKHRCKHSLDESDHRHFSKFSCSFNAKHYYNQDSEPEEPLTGKHRCKEPETCSCPKFNCSFKHCKREIDTNLPEDQDMNIDLAKVLCSCPKFNGKHSKRDVDSSGEERSLIADLAKVLAGKHHCKEPECGACPKFNCLLKNKNCYDSDSKEDNMSVDLAKALIGKHRCKYDEQDTCSFPKMLSDRLQTCTLSGKHRCKDLEELSSASGVDDQLDGTRCVFANLRNQVADLSKSRNLDATKCDRVKACDPKVELELSQKEFVEVLHVLRQSGPLKVVKKPSKGDLLLDALVRCSQTQAQRTSSACSEEAQTHKRKCAPKAATSGLPPARDNLCDMNDTCSDSSLSLGAGNHIYVDISCDKVKRKKTDGPKLCDISNVFSLEYLEKRHKVKVKQRITFDDETPSDHAAKQDVVDTTLKDCKNNDADKQAKELAGGGGNIPSALEQAKFRKSLDSAASMVFHSRTGLPLTSSPAPVRRGKSCFDFDSSINSVSAIRSALFSLTNCSTDEDSESDCSIVSPCSPDATNGLKQRDIPPVKYRHRGQSSGLLGSFVESVLNGRLEPVSTVHGFTAELGASGSFCPRHVVLPVTVFFYTLGDNDKVSTPYLGHINLGKKGYNVPKSGTIQVTLFNPLGTVVKMFVLMYDLSDMPPNAQTFLRQRTLYMPANCHDQDLQWSQKWLRYLIHLRFMSSKSGRIYLHSDIRMIICRKSDLDTATAHGIDMSYELRSFTNTPTNPRFSPRK